MHRTWRSLAEVEREAILEAVAFLGPRRAYQSLGIGKTTLYRKLKLYGYAQPSEVEHRVEETQLDAV